MRKNRKRNPVGFANEPYVKQLDENGICTNPIRGGFTYQTRFPTLNRKARRSGKNFRPFNNKAFTACRRKIRQIVEFTRNEFGRYIPLKNQKVIINTPEDKTNGGNL